MTIETLCDQSLEDWEKLTDADLKAIAEANGWLKITRPELAEKPNKLSSIRRIGDTYSDEKKRKIERARQLAEQYGFDLD